MQRELWHSESTCLCARWCWRNYAGSMAKALLTSQPPSTRSLSAAPAGVEKTSSGTRWSSVQTISMHGRWPIWDLGGLSRSFLRSRPPTTLWSISWQTKPTPLLGTSWVRVSRNTNATRILGRSRPARSASGAASKLRKHTSPANAATWWSTCANGPRWDARPSLPASKQSGPTELASLSPSKQRAREFCMHSRAAECLSTASFSLWETGSCASSIGTGR